MVRKYCGWLPRIDAASPVPVYEQIIEQVAFAVSVGELVPGDALPSVRALAEKLRINPNTAARAIRELESAGLSQPVKGVGSTVANGATKTAKKLAVDALTRELDKIVSVAARLGLSFEELSQALRKHWKEPHEGR